MARTTKKLCPSAECSIHSSIIGVRLVDGRMGYTRAPVAVSQTLAQNLESDVDARRRLRFAAECVTSRCAHWSDDQCAIARDVLVQLRPRAERQALPLCSIRGECRWFHQSGKSACAVCPKVDTIPMSGDAALEAGSGS